MGWMFPHFTDTREKLVEYLREQSRFGDNYELLRSSVKGNHHWFLMRTKSTGKVWIGLDLMQGGTRSNPGWGYKDMDETCGPTAVDCPITYLTEASPVTEADGYAMEWRQRVRAYHDKRKAAATLPQGTVLQYGQHKYRIEPSSDKGTRRTVRRLSDDRIFGMRLSQIIASTIVA